MEGIWLRYRMEGRKGGERGGRAPSRVADDDRTSPCRLLARESMLNAETRRFGGLAAHLWGDPRAQAVVLSHSILTSSAMWRGQVDLLTRHGLFVVGVDTRGHGHSVATPAPFSMSMLVNDA